MTNNTYLAAREVGSTCQIRMQDSQATARVDADKGLQTMIRIIEWVLNPFSY